MAEVDTALFLTAVTKSGQVSLQLGVLGFRLLQDGDFRVGVFPEREEILIGGERPDAGGIGIRALRQADSFDQVSIALELLAAKATASACSVESVSGWHQRSQREVEAVPCPAADERCARAPELCLADCGQGTGL